MARWVEPGAASVNDHCAGSDSRLDEADHGLRGAVADDFHPKASSVSAAALHASVPSLSGDPAL